ncbi:putative exported protein of unknown function [Bradyrhizobium sp. BTAi1]|nr:putative exported protein of unknown function [Bradyrhizobium sp. BTAi1]
MPVRALGPWTASLTLAMTELVGLPVLATAAIASAAKPSRLSIR